MGLINWIFDIYQHSRIDDARRESAQVRAELASMRNQVGQAGGGEIDVDRLEQVLGELALATQALQRVLVEKGVVAHEEFVRILQAVDREDGREDGRSPV